ncbi:hypothetical protein IA01_08910 [Flavobacterium psychrophilum]|nr:hypothetical protein IA03_08880 [Flavobacterium psychrophilum]AIN72808.1 hypothetical protein FPG101_04760 [Flavobacterium psychrophilum FPG101]ROO22998.1 hypothetical protein FPG104_01720 [Flavobacterium psychrophilum 10]AIG32850.1 hypothetical protein IA01_08910 [Flavobacterium psychrophilum]AIG35005.1 hypothetical protein IA02_08295 [Flavobacterium psychrophilum]
MHYTGIDTSFCMVVIFCLFSSSSSAVLCFNKSLIEGAFIFLGFLVEPFLISQPKEINSLKRFFIYSKSIRTPKQ